VDALPINILCLETANTNTGLIGFLLRARSLYKLLEGNRADFGGDAVNRVPGEVLELVFKCVQGDAFQKLNGMLAPAGRGNPTVYRVGCQSAWFAILAAGGSQNHRFYQRTTSG